MSVYDFLLDEGELDDNLRILIVMVAIYYHLCFNL